MDEAAFDRRLMVLGKVANNFSVIEMYASQILSGFVADAKVGNALAANMSFSDVISKLKVLSTIPGLNGIGEQLRLWAAAADEVAQDRNRVIHGSWLFNESDATGRGQRLKLSTRGGRVTVDGVIRLTPESIEDLEAIVTASYNVCAGIAAIIAGLDGTDVWWNPG